MRAMSKAACYGHGNHGSMRAVCIARIGKGVQHGTVVWQPTQDPM